MASLNSLDTSRQRGDPPAPEDLPGYNPQGCGETLVMLVMLILTIAAKVVAG